MLSTPMWSWAVSRLSLTRCAGLASSSTSILLKILAVGCLCDGKKNIPGEQRERENPEKVCVCTDTEGKGSLKSLWKNSGAFDLFLGQSLGGN